MNYKILYEESKELSNGITVYRIEATETSKHASKGTKGGWIAEYGNLIGDAWVDGEAIVYGKATITDEGLISENAVISGEAVVSELAQVSGNAQIYGKAQILLNAQVMGNCIVKEKATITGDAILQSDVEIGGHAWVEGGVWTRTPFHDKYLRYPFTECKPGYIRINCILKTFEDWLYGFYYQARKNNAMGTTKHFFDAYYKTVPAETLEPLMAKFFADSQKDDFKVSNKVMKIILAKHKAWLIEQGKEDYTDQYKF